VEEPDRPATSRRPQPNDQESPIEKVRTNPTNQLSVDQGSTLAASGTFGSAVAVVDVDVPGVVDVPLVVDATEVDELDVVGGVVELVIVGWGSPVQPATAMVAAVARLTAYSLPLMLLLPLVARIRGQLLANV